jgi:hypothetical protein
LQVADSEVTTKKGRVEKEVLLKIQRLNYLKESILLKILQRTHKNVAISA